MAFAPADELQLQPGQVAIALTHGSLGSHLGIAFGGRDGSTILMDLAWHKKLRFQNFPPENWIASTIELPSSAAQQMTALLRGMIKLYANANDPADSVDYGINLFAGRDAIRSNGAYKPSKLCDGYTCASFVAEVLRKVGFHLVNLHSWPTAVPRNEAWAKAIVCMLANTNVPAEHLQKVKGNIQGTRLRPEEVAAASELPLMARPARHEQIQARADSIYEQMLASCGAPPEPSPQIASCVANYRAELSTLAAPAADDSCVDASPTSVPIDADISLSEGGDINLEPALTTEAEAPQG